MNNHFISKDGVSVRYGIFKVTDAFGTAILLNGRTEFIEKYKETIGDLNRFGYDVYTLDWRGQGLSDRMLKNPLKGYAATFDDYIWDLSFFIENIVNLDVSKPHVLLAHSMGGHIAARYLEENPGLVKKAVLTSPMIRFSTGKMPYRIAKAVSVATHYLGMDHFYLIGTGDRPQYGDVFENNKLTSDKDRFLQEFELIKKNPSLALGGVTYGWLYAAFVSMDKIFKYASNINADCLIVSAEKDEVVDNAAHKEIAKRIPACKIFVVKGARHEILNEKDFIRNLFWDQFHQFMKSGS